MTASEQGRCPAKSQVSHGQRSGASPKVLGMHRRLRTQGARTGWHSRLSLLASTLRRSSAPNGPLNHPGTAATPSEAAMGSFLIELSGALGIQNT
jgi:hypothetical protein